MTRAPTDGFASLSKLASQRPEPRPPIRVLIVDDQQAVRELLRVLISEMDGIEVIGEATDGWEGVVQALASQPDVILMDVDMPRVNGIEATLKVRKALPSTRVIGLSGNKGARTHQAMLVAGAETMLSKPEVFTRLYAAILPGPCPPTSRSG